MGDKKNTKKKNERLFSEFGKDNKMKLFEDSSSSNCSSESSSSSSSGSTLNSYSESVSLPAVEDKAKDTKDNFEGRRLDFSGIAELKNKKKDSEASLISLDSDKNSENLKESDCMITALKDCDESADKQKTLSSTSDSPSDEKESAIGDENKELEDTNSEVQELSEKINNETNCTSVSAPAICYDNVEIKVVDIPDDDDLFDFLKPDPTKASDDTSSPNCLDEVSNKSESFEKQTEKDIQKRELYRYLTESDPTQLRSQEVTPYHSGDEHESGSSPSDSDSSDGFHSLSSEHETTNKSQEHEEMKLPDTHFHPPEEDISPKEPHRLRKKPGRKPNPNKPPKKVKPKKVDGQLSKKTLDRLEKSREVTDKWLNDLKVPENLSFREPVHFKIADLNQYLTCGLCKGYLYEASTITECMHTFCKNCIVRHCMEVSLHCPVCNILIHPTDPFVHIRLDRMIQDIVYKLLPNVANTEMENIKAFYKEHPEVEPKEFHQPALKPVISPKEKPTKEENAVQSQLVSLLLESEGDDPVGQDLEKKYVRVTNGATVANVCNFLKTKLNLQHSKKVELFCCGDAMEESSCTLQNIKSKFFGDEDCLMLLQYKVRET